MDLIAKRHSVVCESGQTLIEMAVVIPTFFMLLLGTFSFATVLFGWCNVTFAARSAVRYASIHSNTALVPATTTSATAVVTPFLSTVAAGGSTTKVTYPTTNPTSTAVGGSSIYNTIGGIVTVSVQATYTMTMPKTTFTSFTVSSVAQRTISR